MLDSGRIWNLRDQGMSYRAIAEQVGCSVGSVHSVLNKPDPRSAVQPVDGMSAADIRSADDEFQRILNTMAERGARGDVTLAEVVWLDGAVAALAEHMDTGYAQTLAAWSMRRRMVLKARIVRAMRVGEIPDRFENDLWLDCNVDEYEDGVPFTDNPDPHPGLVVSVETWGEYTRQCQAECEFSLARRKELRAIRVPVQPAEAEW